MCPVEACLLYVLRDEPIARADIDLSHHVRIGLLLCAIVGGTHLAPHLFDEPGRQGNPGREGTARTDENAAGGLTLLRELKCHAHVVEGPLSVAFHAVILL